MERLLRILTVPRSLRRVRPTREGWVFLTTLMAVAMAALNTGNNLLYLVMAAMLSLVAVSSILSEWSIRGLRVSRALEGEAFAGEPLGGRWRVVNRRALVPAVDIRVEEGFAAHARLGGTAPASFAAIAAGGAAVEEANWRFLCRGVHRMSAIRISTAWPFGIFQKWYEVAAPMDVLVFPGRAAGPASHPARGGGGRADADGGSTRASHGSDGDFLGLAEYRDGDDPRRIHWRSSARLARLVAADRGEDRQASVLEISVDAPGPGEARERSQRFETRIAEAAGELWRAVEAGREVRLSLLGQQQPAARDRAGRAQLLRALAMVELPGLAP
jgi:uncharacterized protein (DUF58 family)